MRRGSTSGHTSPAIPNGYTLDCVPERRVRVDHRRHLGHLLADAFNDEHVREAAHFGDPPMFRVVVCHQDIPVAQAGVFRLCTPLQPHIRVLGIGDVAVDPAHRARGLAAVATERALEVAHREDPHVIVTRTVRLAALLTRHGFEPIPSGALPLDPSDAWMAWTPGEGLPHISELNPSDV